LTCVSASLSVLPQINITFLICGSAGPRIWFFLLSNLLAKKTSLFDRRERSRGQGVVDTAHPTIPSVSCRKVTLKGNRTSPTSEFDRAVFGNFGGLQTASPLFSSNGFLNPEDSD
jgi:hypothetical protein